MRVQDVPVSLLPWHSKWTEWSTPAALVMCIIILFTSGFSVFTTGNWSASTFVSSYLDIALVTTAYLLWKFIKRTKIVSLADIPLMEAFERAAQDQEPEKVVPGWRKWVGFLWD
ncbi:hypothetical protein LTR95_013313 [Oleoguttula sp. CCFEE 5521]